MGFFRQLPPISPKTPKFRFIIMEEVSTKSGETKEKVFRVHALNLQLSTNRDSFRSNYRNAKEGSGNFGC